VKRSFQRLGERIAMPTPYDIPADVLIDKLTSFLKENVGEIEPKKWADTAKTGSHRENPPIDSNWWYKRCASLLRKLYLHGPIGVGKLRTEYGGRKKARGLKHSRRSGGSAIRGPLQQMEKAGFIVRESKGRSLSKEGVSLLNKLSGEILREIKSAGVME
jgi:small subunit ribosomal protein S19e